MSLGVDVWSSVLVDYDVPDVPPIDVDGKKLYGNNVKAKNAILFGLSQSELVKVMHCKSAKEVWVKLKQSHEGDDKVKQVKLQKYRAQFENMKMDEEKILRLTYSEQMKLSTPLEDYEKNLKIL